MTLLSANAKKEFICWAQNNTCLICSYPLELHKHLHHIISKDDFGPDHYLNLVALCPNHHYLVERIKRFIIPRQSRSSNQWLEIGQAALQLRREMPEDKQQILDILSRPHKLSNVIKNGVSGDFIERAAEDLMKEDAKLLDAINKKRPRIFLSPSSYRIVDNEADKQADDIAGQVGLGFFSEVISSHMKRLNLPYRAIINDSAPNKANSTDSKNGAAD